MKVETAFLRIASVIESSCTTDPFVMRIINQMNRNIPDEDFLVSAAASALNVMNNVPVVPLHTDVTAYVDAIGVALAQAGKKFVETSAILPHYTCAACFIMYIAFTDNYANARIGSLSASKETYETLFNKMYTLFPHLKFQKN